MSPTNTPNGLVNDQLLYFCDTYSTKLTRLESSNAFPGGKGRRGRLDVYTSLKVRWGLGPKRAEEGGGQDKG